MNCTLVLMNTFPFAYSDTTGSSSIGWWKLRGKFKETLKYIKQLSQPPFYHKSVPLPEKRAGLLGGRRQLVGLALIKTFSVTSLDPNYTAHHHFVLGDAGAEAGATQLPSKCIDHKKENFIFTSSLFRVKVPLHEDHLQNCHHSLANASEMMTATCSMPWLEVLFQPYLED